ncbi:MAG TPA: hypothetical protein VFE98_01545 [Candidatus Bathyarchaeia archaeon]|nr:hypothetical protein [Candidatus Bathyarchaeia archaeon]
MRTRVLLLTALLVAVVYIQVLSEPVGVQKVRNVGFGPDRSVSLNIRIVFIGMSRSQLNLTTLTSNITALSLKYQTILAGPIDTGVVFNFKYQTIFADNVTVGNFAAYLSSIVIRQDSYPGSTAYPALVNPYFSNSTTLSSARNYFYDADKVEAWLASNPTLTSISNGPGYTLFVADLHNLGIPSLTPNQYGNYTARCSSCPPPVAVDAHYYNRTITDPDLGLRLQRHYMTGWGGSGRFYYMDLSAGPSYWTNELPLQVASRVRGVDVNSYYGRVWTSKFVSAYISGAVDNLFAPDQLYPVSYSQRYDFQVFVFDNRTVSEKSTGPLINTTVDRARVQAQLSNLLPFSTVSVNVIYADVNDYPGLAMIVANATTTLKDPSSGRPIVDGQIVYNWLTSNGQGHIRQFINVTRTFTKIDVPSFVFALKGNYTFGFPFKEFIASTSSRATFAGEALGDMVLIGLSQGDFKLGSNTTTYNQPGKGLGFTHAVIHEFGHMVGLNHPFIYDQTEDFTNTVMGYYAYSLAYSQFDKDTILRGVNDQLLTYAQQTLANTASNVFNAGSISNAQSNIAKANQLYDSMDYASAVPYSLSAAESALQASQVGGTGALSSALVYVIIGILVGVAAGLLVGYLVFRRRKTSGVQYNLCPTCQSPLRWDPVQMHWLCDKCQKPALT